METPNLKEERLIRDFRLRLDGADYLDDMFPPDSGVREPDPNPTSPQNPPKELGAMVMTCAVSNGELIAA